MQPDFIETVNTPWGLLTAYATTQGIYSISFREHSDIREEQHTFPFEFESMVTEYIDGQRKDFPLPLILVGNAEQIRIWYAIMEIPYGHFEGPAEVASLLDIPVDRVTQAAVNNPLELVIPVHRMDMNSRLLQFERAHVNTEI